MAIVRFKLKDIINEVNLEEDRLINVLSDLGMPAEVIEDEVEIEITPDRPDMLTFFGIVRAINQYINSKEYTYSLEDRGLMLSEEEVKQRPYIAMAAVIGVKNRTNLIEYLIQTQEKMHETFGRKRRRIAIGIHDFDYVEPPFTYKEVEDETFIPLDWNKKANIGEILAKHEKGIKFKHLVKKPYPMLYDARGVISFPPIINSERTKLRDTTKNFLIDVTGTHKETVKMALNILVTELADRGGKIISVRGKETYPDLKEKEMELEVGNINKLLGTSLAKEKMVELLKRMGYKYKKKLLIPPYRADILDFTDIAEDVAIAIGYNNIGFEEIKFNTIGKRREFEVKRVFTDMGFIEVTTFFLDNKEKTREVLGNYKGVELINSLNEELNGVRTSLLVPLLRVEAQNKMKELPHKVFEVGHVFSEEEKVQLGFAICDKEVIIEQGISVVKRFADEMGLSIKESKVKWDEEKAFVWHWKFEGDLKGIVGIVHPQVLEMFNINNVLLIGLMEGDILRQRV